MMSSFLLIAALIWSGQSAQVEVGKRMLQARQWDQALEAFQLAVESDPLNGEAHYYLAQLFAYRGDERDTIAHFREALRLLPNQEIIWSEYGNWLLSQAYFDEAERVFGKLLEMSPQDPGYWRQLGLTVYENGKPEEALPAYEKAIALDPNSGQAFYLAGVAARSMSLLQEAKEFFQQGLAVDGHHPELNLQMAELLLQEGALQEALVYLQKLPEDHLAGNYNRGVVLMRLNQLSAAERLLLRVVQEDPSHTGAHYQLGRLYARMKKKELSQQFFERFRILEEQDRQRNRITQKKSIVEKPSGPRSG